MRALSQYRAGGGGGLIKHHSQFLEFYTCISNESLLLTQLIRVPAYYCLVSRDRTPLRNAREVAGGLLRRWLIGYDAGLLECAGEGLPGRTRLVTCA